MNALGCLEECPLFARVSRDALARLAAVAERVELGGGDTLFLAGTDADALFIVATGRLRAVYPNGRVAGDITRLEPIGEIGMLTGDPRGASVHALRASVLYRFPRLAFTSFAAEEPSALMAMTKVIMDRLRAPSREARLRAARKTRTLAVVSSTAAIDSASFCRSLAQSLGPDCALITSAEAPMATTARDGGSTLRSWLADLEFSRTSLVFDSLGPEAWTLNSIRQADRVLVLADAREPPNPSFVQQLMRAGLRSRLELVVLRAGGQTAEHLSAWREALPGSEHFFCRPGNLSDIASLGRQLTGHALGLVLGGGGARGFAHVGLLRALRELDMPVDVIGGSSMGAMVAALHAQGRAPDDISATLKDCFVHRKLLNDYTFPRLSIIKGEKFRRYLDGFFGVQAIEQLATPYFCVSTNLTQGNACIHRSGRLSHWLATSMCIPAFAPPVGYRGDLLCDGAVVNSLPTDVMQDLGRGLILASDVSTEGAISAPTATADAADFDAVYAEDVNGRRTNLVDVIFRVTSLTSESGTKRRAESADLYLRMPVTSHGTFDWANLQAICDKGYRHAMSHLPALKARMEAERGEVGA